MSDVSSSVKCKYPHGFNNVLINALQYVKSQEMSSKDDDIMIDNLISSVKCNSTTTDDIKQKFDICTMSSNEASQIIRLLLMGYIHLNGHDEDYGL